MRVEYGGLRRLEAFILRDISDSCLDNLVRIQETKTFDLGMLVPMRASFKFLIERVFLRVLS